MTKQIDVDTLREWLDSGRPVTVVDIRSGEDRAQWGNSRKRPRTLRGASCWIAGSTQRLSDWLTSETAFIERVTSRLPPTPLNFARIVQLNEHGELPREDPAELEAGANRCAVRWSR